MRFANGYWRLLLTGTAFLVLIGPLAAASAVRLHMGSREITIETLDPAVEIVVQEDRGVRIVDTTTGKESRIDCKEPTVSLGDDAGGLAIALDAELPVLLKRHSEPLASVRAPVRQLPAAASIPTKLVGTVAYVPTAGWMPKTEPAQDVADCDGEETVLPPIPPGTRPEARAPRLARIEKALPLPVQTPLYRETRDDLDGVVEKLVDEIEPPRFYPLIGPAQVHHGHWKCTVTYDETVAVSFPFAFEIVRRQSQVVYVDTDHLHIYQANDNELRDMTRDLGWRAGAGSGDVALKTTPTEVTYRVAYERVLQVLSGLFEVNYANAYEGRVETAPQEIPGTNSRTWRWAVVQIRPAEKGGFLVDVRVDQAREGQSLGRDGEMEQAIRKELAGWLDQAK
jgi:hypothetical protein